MLVGPNDNWLFHIELTFSLNIFKETSDPVQGVLRMSKIINQGRRLWSHGARLVTKYGGALNAQVSVNEYMYCTDCSYSYLVN